MKKNAHTSARTMPSKGERSEKGEVIMKEWEMEGEGEVRRQSERGSWGSLSQRQCENEEVTDQWKKISKDATDRKVEGSEKRVRRAGERKKDSADTAAGKGNPVEVGVC